MTEEQYIQLIESNGMSQFRNDLLSLARNGISVTTQQVGDENEIPVGHTKMGGNPDLPKGFVWPKYKEFPLTFISQFRLSEVTPYDINRELPRTGMLYFFYEASGVYGGSREDQEARQVVFIDDETTPLIRHIHPKQSGAIFPIEALPACKVILEQTVNTPHYEQGWEHLRTVWDKKQENLYWHIMYRWEPHPNNHLLGTPYQIQNDMRLECVKESKILEWQATHTPEVIEEAKDWQLLFQIDCDNNLKVEWGDAGMVYFWIRKQDLQNKIFDKTWAIMQCY
ncbi:MAG: DUF1963 domain-containing protein [Anaerolineaceae bacterium]|nr:DUF1963 domain-containing protein [Anaerolineaceae bacterium]